MECCHLLFVNNTTAYHLGRYSLHLLILKISVDQHQREMVAILSPLCLDDKSCFVIVVVICRA